jgi:hypothetical protein
LEGERVVASTPAVVVAVESTQHLLVAPEGEVMAQYSVPVPAAARRSAVLVQHFEPAGEAVGCAVVFEKQHSGPVKETAAEAVGRVEKAAQVVMKHCFPAARNVAEQAAQVVVLRHCFLAVRTAVGAAQLVAPDHHLAVARTAAEEAARHCWFAVEAASEAEELAQLAAPEHCLEVARTAVEVAAKQYWPAVAAEEEAASKAEEFARAVVLERRFQAARIVALAAAKLEHSALKCTAAVAAR